MRTISVCAVLFALSSPAFPLELARHVMQEPIMASPAISDGLLIIRTLQHVWAIGR